MFFFGLNFFGIGDIDDKYMFVCFMDVYYDCKMFNKWILSVVVLIVDFMLRYFNYIYLRRLR